MRHPFDGILPADDNEQPLAASSRRQVLQWIAGASAVPLAMQLTSSASATPEGDSDGIDRPAVGGYRLYFVVPKQFRSFSTRRRNDLGVQGNYLPGLTGNEELKSTKGFLAWLTEGESAEIESAGDVQAVHRIDADDIAVQGALPGKGAATLRVHAAPYQWNAELPKDSYVEVDALGGVWARQFSMHEGVKIVANRAVRTPFVQFADAANVPQAVVDAIKEHPQVYAMEWLTPIGPSTQRLGEEGGATTLRVGEEGGVTTQALGEEGGGPRPSTRALGEEGGGRPRPQPTTLAIGEEGGVRPAPRPIPLPQPQPTTLALGEEGGRQ